MQHIFIVKAYLHGIDDYIFVPDYAGGTLNDVEVKVMEKAWREGFKGSIEARLKELSWSIVRCSLTELAETNGAIAGAAEVEKAVEDRKPCS